MFALAITTRILTVSGKNLKAHLFYSLALEEFLFRTTDANFCQKEIPIFVTFG
jgi:hypothetical protein